MSVFVGFRMKISSDLLVDVVLFRYICDIGNTDYQQQKSDKTMKQEDVTELTFELRSYGKRELAAMYNPRIDENSAVKMLNRWIKEKPGLPEALGQTGLNPRAKCYTPLQVRLIVEALGAP